MNSIKNKTNIVLAFVLICILISSSLPLTSSVHTNPLISLLDSSEQKDLYLLRVEHYLELDASEDVNQFYVTYAFPPNYGYQVPIVMELHNDSTALITSYCIQKDTYDPNRVINFTISSMLAEENQLIHFSVWVLVENHDFSDIQEDISLPQSKYDSPEETWLWLSRSDVVQTKRLQILYRAHQLQGENDNILSYAQNISSFIKNHRYGLFVIQLTLNLFLKQDAMTTLHINGENVGRAHLACAFFRSQDIPARVILANNDQGFWTQMHYMVEYYIPSYGWVLLDTTKGLTPYLTKRQVINRICSIDDEDDTKHDYIMPFMKGEERWIWLSTPFVEPYYVDCDEASKSQMFTESLVQVSSFVADYVFFRTQNVFHQYEAQLGASLNPANQQHVEKAQAYQLQAAETLCETGDINDYVFYLEKAYDEYKAIEE